MKRERSSRNREVCAFGTFDVLHLGHITYLEYARRKGSRLTVVVTRDAVVHRRKGVRPLFSERDRRAMISSLRAVDRALLGDRSDTWAVIKNVRPDLVCFGYDQSDAIESLRASRAYQEAGRPRISVAPAFRPNVFHSRMIKQAQ